MNRRIDRPSYWDLTPFVVYRDQYSYFSGNPYLQPEYSNTAEITYVFKKFITNSISYSRVKDFMLDYTQQNDSTRILLKQAKYPYEDALAYLLFIQYDFTKWYNVSFNANVTYLVYKGDIKGVPFHTKGINYNLNLTNTFLLPKK